jgi:translocation and assembly module TamB
MGQGRVQEDQSYLASLISRVLSTPATRVSIGVVEGALSSDATVRDIVISDRDGVWLRLDRARLVWRRTALLARRLEIDTLEIGKLEILRRPLAAEEPVVGEDQPILPELPVKVVVKSFTLQELALGEPVVGTSLRAGANGSLSLGPPAEGLALRFDAKRLDAAGAFTTRLDFVPQTNELDLNLALDEPAGGFLSRVAGLPNEPPVKLDLNGKGTLDDFRADLSFEAGPTVGAKGGAQLRREGSARRLGLDLAAQIAGLLPALVAPVFPGTTELVGDMRFGDEGGFALSNLSLVSQIARLDSKGTVGVDGALDFAIQARAVPTAQGTTLAGDAEIRRLVFDGTITGTAARPKVAATLDLADARLPEGALKRLNATFTADPTGAVTEDATRIRLAADINASGLMLSDPALARAIGDRIDMTLRGDTDLSGNGRYEVMRLRSPSLELSYVGELGRAVVRGKASARAPELARFGDVAGLALSGQSELIVDLDGSPRYNRVSALIDARTSALRTGIAQLDALLGPAPRVIGTLRTAPRGRYEFDALQIVGAHVRIDVSGFAEPSDANLRARIDIADLSRADSRLTGAASVQASLTNGLDRPNVSLTAQAPRATALGRPIENLSLDAVINDLRGAFSAEAKLAGSVNRKPATGVANLARRPAGGYRLDALDLRIGSVTLQGSGEVDAQDLARGQIAFDAGNLDDLSALVLTKLDGRLSAAVDLEAPEGRQNARVSAKGEALRAGEARIRTMVVNGDLRDIYSRPVVDGSLAIDEAVVAGEAFSAIRLSAQGATDASNLVLTAKARGFSLDAAARLVPGEATRLDISRLVAQRGSRRIALNNPAQISFRDGGVDLQRVALAIEGGQLAVQGRAGDTLDLTVNARAIPLSAIDIFAPGTGLSGTLQGDARITGAASAPTGSYRVEMARLVAPQLRGAGVPPLAIVASGQLQNQRATVDATINAGSAGRLTFTGAVPFGPSAPLDLSARGNLDAAIANATLGPAGRRLTGRVALDMRVAGSRSAPRLSGAATLSGGTFRDTLQGVQLDSLNARLRAEGETLIIESVSATTPRDGRLSATGRVQIDPAAGFPGDISIRGQRAVLVSNSLLNATADLALDLTGPLARTPRISGRIDLTRLDVAVPDRLPTTLRPIEKTRHIAPPPQVARRLAAQRSARAAAGGRQAMFVATLDLAITAPNRIFIRGRGLDAVLGGSLRLTGTTSDPVAIGAFDLARGKLAILGQRLDFSRGRLAFAGSLIPDLDFLASTQAGEVTANVAVTGPANEPAFAFSSQPDLPQDEVLSRILFARASGGLSPFQALQLAQVASQFSGGGGDDSFERLRKSLGVDSLDIQAGPGGPSVGISRAISDRVSIGVKAGATPDQTGLSVDVDVTRRLRVQSEVGSNGGTSVGVGAEWEY